MKPHRCPVCYGNGLVPNGTYRATGPMWQTNSTESEVCRSCNGTGVVWELGVKLWQPEPAPPTTTERETEVSEKQIDAILSVLAEEGCLPYMASIRAIAPEPGPMTDEQKAAWAQAHVEAEQKNREFARRILRAATQRGEKG